MLFDEIKIDTITDDGELYVNVSQLISHLEKAIDEFHYESSELAKIVPLGIRERVFLIGLIEGMHSVKMMLGQANDEYTIGSIDTIDELLERFKDESE